MHYRAIKDFYCGAFGVATIETAKNRANKNVNRSLMESQEHLVLQSHIENDLQEELVC
jgi:hypothetical protein